MVAALTSAKFAAVPYYDYKASQKNGLHAGKEIAPCRGPPLRSDFVAAPPLLAMTYKSF